MKPKATATRRKSAARKKTPATKGVKIHMDAKTKKMFKGKNSVWSFYVNRVISSFARAVK